MHENNILSEVFLGFSLALKQYFPAGLDSRIHRLQLCRGVRPPPANGCPGYDIKQADGEGLVMLELGEMRSTPSLSLLPGLLWPGMVALDRALSMV